MNDWIASHGTVIGIVSGVLAFILVVIKAFSNGIQAEDLPVILAGFGALMAALGINGKQSQVLKGVEEVKLTYRRN